MAVQEQVECIVPADPIEQARLKRETTTALGGTLTAVSLENAFPNLPY